MTKAEIVAKLEEAKIEHDPSKSKAELEALLPAAPSTTTNTSNDTGANTDKADEPEEKGAKGEATVYSRNGNNPLRTYTKELHGPKYKELAKEYAGKINGTVR